MVTTQYNNESHGGNEDGGIGVECQVGIEQRTYDRVFITFVHFEM